jgi:murein DD-endopeptidase MepM/ murein hydrolase activator NlpD
LKRKKKRSNLLTFTILSNDASQVVKQFHMNKSLLYSIAAFAAIPVLALIYYIHANHGQQAEIEELSSYLKVETAKSEQLQDTMAVLEEETGDTRARLKELTELEVQMRNYINELPTLVEPSGGIHIAADGTNTEVSADGLSFLASKELVERYKETLAIADEVSIELQYTPTAWPTNPDSITSDFGVRNDPFQRSSSFHSGVDIRGYYGTPVYATADGTVTMAKYYSSYGNAIIIKHSSTFQTLYGHLMEIDVEDGEVVKKGDIIGSVGSTGRSTGPHLHYEVIKDGEPVDPKAYFNLYGEFDIE